LFPAIELENQLKQQQPPDLKREITTVDGESSQRVRELEKIIRLLKQEKEEAQKVKIYILFYVKVCFCLST
jgi:tellurite resistance protein